MKVIVGITSPSSIILLDGQLKYFSDKGYDMYLMCPVSPDVIEFCRKENCTHIPINIKRDISLFSDIKSLFSIYLLLKKIKPDIVNFGTPKISLLGLIASFVLSIKLRIYTCRGFRFEHEVGIKKNIMILMEKISSKCSHKIICIAPSLRDKGVKLNIFPKTKCYVINKGSSNGIILNKFSKNNLDRNKIEGLKKQLKIENNFVYGFVGRIIDRKGINELFEAFDKLYKEDMNNRLLIVGDIEYAQISNERLIPCMKSHPGIVMVGFQKDVPLYMSLMDIFVLPAWWEGFGNVLVQAAAMGIPVISTRSTGCSDAVNDGYNGVLVPVKDVDSLFNALKKLKYDLPLSRQMGKNGVLWAKNFNQNLIWEGLDKIYNE